MAGLGSTGISALGAGRKECSGNESFCSSSVGTTLVVIKMMTRNITCGVALNACMNITSGSKEMAKKEGESGVEQKWLN